MAGDSWRENLIRSLLPDGMCEFLSGAAWKYKKVRSPAPSRVVRSLSSGLTGQPDRLSSGRRRYFHGTLIVKSHVQDNWTAAKWFRQY